MKKYFFIVAPILWSLLMYVQSPAQPTAGDLNKLNWLEGTWLRTNSKPGFSGQEQWKKISATEWQGRGVTLQGIDTVEVEKIKVTIRDGSIYYVADVPENRHPVYFKFTEISSTQFGCENPAHDFPKKIMYWKEGTTLKAAISGDGKSIEYWFERK